MMISVGSRRITKLSAALVAFLVVSGTAPAHAGILDGLWGRSPAAAAKAAGVAETPDAVRIPLKALDSGKALFLATDTGGTQLRFFALRSGDGKYRAALDACDVCFRANKGYRQEGDRMVCNNCGQTFASNRIGEKKGGCNPHPLPHREEGGFLTVAKADLAAVSGYFQGNRR